MSTMGANSAQAAPNTYIAVAEKGSPSGVATLDANAKILPAQLPDLYATFANYVNLAKNPDTIIAGAVTVDGLDRVTSAAVAWPDGTPGTLTITARHATGAVNGYTITYGSPVTKTFTQPTIARNSNGAATNVPQIVVS
ncbi:hypothetical protein GU243_10915 [Pseudarthrobacter psychrotolerans]|uniref:Uncharacterized protein n=1 Tax=Pseudarthrobacter psychrotolerans TaxID=2697569 RepID=A0A6P1NP24_9MICC|nr:hypothetical protein [Pseudarthrobacter psychrotolerans]QHK20160.1 hypothetical protein GU243_10915 [Pseudarthrobacter psychrotolerans]